MVALLAVVLCASPVVPAVDGAPRSARLLPVKLMTREEAQKAPVDALSWAQLEDEQLRLSNPPSAAPGFAMLPAGLAAAGIGGFLTWLLLTDLSRQGNIILFFFEILGVVCTGAVAVAGTVIAIVGGVILGVRLSQQAEYADRLAVVKARMQAIRDGRASMPAQDPGETPDAQRRLWALEEKKPGYGLPIALLAGGAGGVAYGLLTLLAVSPGSLQGFALTGVGAIAIGVGLFVLASQINARDAYYQQVREFEASPPADATPPPPLPPPSPQGVDRNPMPPPPVFATFAARF